ncbi:MAG TPA: hypothetical protein PKY82_21580 [Pyrinomonadaceae bacterium]|nr:hypothetical protein [Pyrinomonadaceae bacterium]
MSKAKHIHCDKCSTMTETKMMTRKIPRLGKMYEITFNGEVCPNCDNAYIPGKFVQEFEKSLKKKELIAA